MKILRIGDPHVKVNNLEESEALLRFSFDIAKHEKIDRVEILGDLFHTHAVVRLEVIQFWHNWLTIFSKEFETVVLEGNHDQSGDYASNYSALSVFKLADNENLHIIEKPTLMGNIGYIPYIHDPQKFIDSANDLAQKGATVLVVHQTLLGSKYENGFFASDGADTTKISDKIIHIISGHIHSRQEFGRIIYPGTGRWDSAADANQPKGIGVFCHEEQSGRISDHKYVSTEGVCSPLYELRYQEGEVEPSLPAGRVVLELVGTSDWIDKEKQKFKGKAILTTKITDAKKLENRQPGMNFEDFLTNVFVSTMDRQALLQCAKEMGIV